MEGDGDAAAAKLLSEPTGSTTGSRRSLGIIDESQLDLSHFIWCYIFGMCFAKNDGHQRPGSHLYAEDEFWR